MVIQQHPRVLIVLVGLEQGLGATPIIEVGVGCSGHFAVENRRSEDVHPEAWSEAIPGWGGDAVAVRGIEDGRV